MGVSTSAVDLVVSGSSVRCVGTMAGSSLFKNAFDTSVLCILLWPSTDRFQPATAFPVPALKNTAAVPISIRFATSTRAIQTTLTFLAFILVSSTYFLLIYRAPALGSTSKFPFKILSKDVNSLLSMLWPDHSTDTAPIGPDDATNQQNAIRLLYLGSMEPNQGYKTAKGICESEAVPEKRIPPRFYWVTSGSPTTKNMVRVLIWEWVGIWLACIMYYNTLSYNGFISGNRNHDSGPRMFVISVYFAAYILHIISVIHRFLRFLSLATAGASWTILNRASFAVVNREQLFRHLAQLIAREKEEGQPPSPISFQQIEQANEVNQLNPRYFNAALPGYIPIPNTDDRERESRLSDALKKISNIQESQRRNVHESSTKALDLIIANAVLMLGISLSTTFSVWTATNLSDNTSTQIGSLALLTSATLGLTGLVKSATSLGDVNDCFTEILRLKELKINGQAINFTQKRKMHARPVSFAQGSCVTPAPSSLRGLVAWNQGKGRLFPIWLAIALFGPGFMLLPTAEEVRQNAEELTFELDADVRGHRVLLTTEGTDRHQTEGGENVDAINVCFHPAASRVADADEGTDRHQREGGEDVDAVNVCFHPAASRVANADADAEREAGGGRRTIRPFSHSQMSW